MDVLIVRAGLAAQEAWASGRNPGGSQREAHARSPQQADRATVPQPREASRMELTFVSSKTGNDCDLLTEQGKAKADRTWKTHSRPQGLCEGDVGIACLQEEAVGRRKEGMDGTAQENPSG